MNKDKALKVLNAKIDAIVLAGKPIPKSLQRLHRALRNG